MLVLSPEFKITSVELDLVIRQSTFSFEALHQMEGSSLGPPSRYPAQSPGSAVPVKLIGTACKELQ